MTGSAVHTIQIIKEEVIKKMLKHSKDNY